MGGAPVIEEIRAGVSFSPPAAASFRRAEASWRVKTGRVSIDCNSSTRSWDLQLSMYLAWELYDSGRGPYPGHSMAVHPDYSKHCLGLGLDSDDWVVPGFIEHMAEHGWIRTAASNPTERHHFEYQWWNDKHRNDPTPPASVSASVPILTPKGRKMDLLLIAVEPTGGGLRRYLVDVRKEAKREISSTKFDIYRNTGMPTLPGIQPESFANEFPGAF